MTELQLTERERQALRAILASKERELLVESRRTDSIRLRGELRSELRTVDRLMQRIDGLTQTATRAGAASAGSGSR